MGILKTGFQPKFCDEYSLHGYDVKAMRERKPPRNFTAMVCFCDLPLGLLKSHIKFYGEFGIGLKKEWGLRQGIEPVIYSHRGGQRMNPFEQLLGTADSETAPHILLIEAFVKRWKGKQWRNGKYHYREFYNEREWRYVPTFSDGSPIRIANEIYLMQNKRQVEKVHLEPRPLKFGPDDIQYIIVPDDSHILKVHELLKSIYSKRDAILTTTTIMTVDCIYEDA